MQIFEKLNGRRASAQGGQHLLGRVADKLVVVSVVFRDNLSRSPKIRLITLFTSSGSRTSDMAVNPERSENTTVTCFRSPPTFCSLSSTRLFWLDGEGVFTAGVTVSLSTDPPSFCPHSP